MESSGKRQLFDIADRAETDEAFRGRLEKDPIGVIRDEAARFPNPLIIDKWIYRIVVTFLGSAIIISVSGAIYIAVLGGDTPEILLAIGSASVGALAGLLAPKPEATA